MTYIIAKWSEFYEKADLRKVRHASWVPIPNSWDSRGYIAIAKEGRNAPAIFGVWILLLQIASRSPVRGRLEGDGGPLSLQDMSDLTRMPVEAFERAFPVLLRVGWITTDPAEVSADCAETRGSFPTTGQDITGQDRTGHNRTGQGTGGDDSPRKGRFAPPTLPEVSAFVQENGYTVDAERFHSYYTSNGWKVGRNPMRDWRAAVRQWNARDSQAISPAEKAAAKANAEARTLRRRRQELAEKYPDELEALVEEYALTCPTYDEARERAIDALGGKYGLPE